MRGERRSRTGGPLAPRRALAVVGAALTVSLLAVAAPSIEATAHPAPTGTTTEAVTPVVGVVGDMACDASDPKFNAGSGTSSNCQEMRISDLMLADPSLVDILGLGDFQYDCGDLADYAVSYDPTWGRLDLLMSPVPGNHDYKTGLDLYGQQCPTDNTTAHNYFAHFGALAHPATTGHYSFDLGTWHVIALNSNCGKSGVGGCSATSPQTTWLKQDLATTTQPCIAAFWHHPLFSADHFNGSPYRPWWNALYAAHADVVLNGHVHNYERFAALDPSGAGDATNGITEYIVGTGGENFTALNTTVQPQPTIFRRQFGYLRMNLDASGWTAQFINSTGAVSDTSSGTCHS